MHNQILFVLVGFSPLLLHYHKAKIPLLLYLSREKEAIRMLTESQQPVTINHLMAAGFLTSKTGTIWKNLSKEEEQILLYLSL